MWNEATALLQKKNPKTLTKPMMQLLEEPLPRNPSKEPSKGTLKGPVLGSPPRQLKVSNAALSGKLLSVAGGPREGSSSARSLPICKGLRLRV